MAKWAEGAYVRSISEQKLTGFADGLEVRQRGVSDDLKVFDRSTWLNAGTVYCNEKVVERAGLGWGSPREKNP